MTTKPHLDVLLAAPRGFCAGVDRAIQIVEMAIEKFGAPVYVRHEIVHNRTVVESLEAKGAVFVEELSEVPNTDAPVIFSAHGVPKSVPAEAAERKFFYLDATCPLVSKVHVEAERHFEAGLEIILIGHSGHPEVIGTLGQLPEGAVTLIEKVKDVEAFTPRDPSRTCLYNADDAVDRRHHRDGQCLEGALPPHPRSAQGRHLLRDDKPAARCESDC